MGWRDWKLMTRFLVGFQVVGVLEDSHIWSPVDVIQPESDGALLQEREALMTEMLRRQPNKDTTFLWD